MQDFALNHPALTASAYVCLVGAAMSVCGLVPYFIYLLMKINAEAPTTIEE